MRQLMLSCVVLHCQVWDDYNLPIPRMFVHQLSVIITVSAITLAVSTTFVTYSIPSKQRHLLDALTRLTHIAPADRMLLLSSTCQSGLMLLRSKLGRAVLTDLRAFVQDFLLLD
jgi:acetamidase/formamidase